jgi:hypothetical protein
MEILNTGATDDLYEIGETCLWIGYAKQLSQFSAWPSYGGGRFERRSLPGNFGLVDQFPQLFC